MASTGSCPWRDLLARAERSVGQEALLVAERQDATGQTGDTHTDGDGGQPSRVKGLQHVPVIRRSLRHADHLNHVGALLLEPGRDVRQRRRHSREVVVGDDHPCTATLRREE